MSDLLESAPQVIDDLDKGIIKCLSKDGRMSFTEIASQLNVTEKTIRSRYKNLLENNILEVVGIINPISLGIKTGAIILLRVEPQKLDQVIKQVKIFQEIRYVTLISGEYQLLVQINVPTQDHIRDTIKALNRIEGITKLNSLVQLEVYKNTFDLI